jgi:imidazolonepropionase-like amidohydrolase
VATVPIPEDARVIYGSGLWMTPGLIDMHVHIRAADLDQYLRSGITTVRDMAGLPSVLALARSIEAGDRAGPQIIAATRLIDGPSPSNPQFSVVLPRVSAAQQVVDSELARGCTFVKVYDRLTLAEYDAVVAAARARGVKVSGHVPQGVSIEHALASQDSIEHLSRYDLSRAGDQAAMTRQAGVWNCPTMHVFTAHVTANMDPEVRRRLLAARSAMVGALRESGARLLAGTDAGYLVPAGTSLVEELEELHHSGLTRFEALAAATRDAAEYLERTDIGTIGPGSRADLLLLDANPLESFDTLRRPYGVVVEGAWRPLSVARRRAVAR